MRWVCVWFNWVCMLCLSMISVCGMPPCYQNRCGKHADCGFDSCVCVIYWYLNPHWDDVVVCMSVCKAWLIGLPNWLHCRHAAKIRPFDWLYMRSSGRSFPQIWAIPCASSPLCKEVWQRGLRSFWDFVKLAEWCPCIRWPWSTSVFLVYALDCLQPPYGPSHKGLDFGWEYGAVLNCAEGWVLLGLACFEFMTKCCPC